MAPRGMTLVDVIVGTAIMLVVFLSIFAAFRISIELVFSTKAKTGAVSLLTERLEYIRGLPYADVGTVGGIPTGSLAQTEQQSLNGVDYTVRTLIQYTDAPEDGLDANDENGITADYKTVKVEVLWNIRNVSRSTYAVTRIAPVGQESLSGGGTLRVNVFDQNAQPVPAASVRIVNSGTTPAIDVTSETNTSGSVSFPGTPEASGYEIYVTKDGYSSAQTYGVTTENPNPSPIHVSVVESQTTTASFAIDVDSVLRVFTYEPPGAGSFTDSFNSASGLMSTSSTAVVSGALTLEEDPVDGYAASGNAFSNAIAPSLLSSWNEITFASSTPENTTLAVRLYYFDGSVYTLVPDEDLPNNSAGLTESPIDISVLDTGVYTSLQLGAFLTSADASTTPELLEWELSYVAGPTPLPNVSFAIHGAKTVGTDAGGEPVYKYEDTFTTTQFAEWFIDPIEWDAYTVTLADTDAYDVVERCPHSIAPDPGEVLDVSFTLGDDTVDSLRVAVIDSSGSPIRDATVQITGPDSASDLTGSCGQTYFGGIEDGVYTVVVSKSGFQTYMEDISVSAETEFLVSLLSN